MTVHSTRAIVIERRAIGFIRPFYFVIDWYAGLRIWYSCSRNGVGVKRILK